MVSRKGSKKVTQLEERLKDLENQLKRVLADYDNLEKRMAAERADFIRCSNASLIDKLLGVLDDLERAEEHLKNKGLSLAVNQFRRTLETEGVEEIKALGERFDPELMDCVEIVKGSKDKVMTVILKGYLLNGRTIRPAKVKVGKGK